MGQEHSTTAFVNYIADCFLSRVGDGGKAYIVIIMWAFRFSVSFLLVSLGPLPFYTNQLSTGE